MRNVFRLFTLFTFCFFSQQTSAQLTLTIADQMVNCESNNFCVDVDVANFNQVSGMQFALRWDPLLFSYASHQDFLPTPPLFNLPDTTLGSLSQVWFSNDFLNGLTLPDDSTILTLCLEPLANAGTVDSITIAPQPGVGQSVQFSTIPDGILNNSTQVSLSNSTINIFDNVPPSITCPPDDTVYTATLTGVDPTIMENCAIEFLTHTLSGATNNVGTGSANGSVLQEGVTNISYVATDYAGQSDGCNFNITYNDTSMLDPNVLYFVPEITHDCANDKVTIDVKVINFDSLASMQFGIFWDTAMIKYTAHTNLLPPSANFINTLTPDGTLVLIWVPNPTAGGVTLADSTSIFTIEFDVSSNLILPLISFDTINTLNLEIGSLRDFAVGGRLDTSQWVLQNGNLTVLDMMPPVLDCSGLSNAILTSDANACGTTHTWTPPTATDDCGTVSVVGSHMPGDFFSVGTDTVVYIATDGAGNTDTCSFTVTVSDNQRPTLSCPANVTVNNDVDDCGAVVNGIALLSAMDNCPFTTAYVLTGATVAGPIAGNDASGTFFNVDTTTVTYTVTDDSGNSESCSFLVIVNDTQNPTITCPANISVSTDMGSCDAMVTVPDPSISDNCPGFTLTNDFNNTASASGTYPVGTTTVMWLLIDSHNNRDSCTFTVTVTDNQAPTITCPANISVSTDMGSCDAMVTVPDPSISDNCPGFTLTNDFNNTASASGTYPIGTTTVMWLLIDSHNNRDSCTMTVTVADNQAPTITCPTDISILTDMGGCDAMVTVPAPTIVENCPGATVVNDFNNTADASGTYPIGVTTVTWTVTDANNNMNSCTMTVTVTDNMPLSITCPANVIINNATGPTVVNNIDPTVSNACGTATVTYRRISTMVETGTGSLSGATFQPGQTNVTYFVTDATGEIDSCSFTVTVDVPNSDLIDCIANPANTDNEADSCNAIVNNIDPIFLVAQGGVTLTYTLTGATTGMGMGSASGQRFNVGTTQVTYIATNGSVNDTCRFDVVVLDVQQPSITCPADIVVDAASALCSQNVSWTVPTPTDNCPGVILTSSHVPGNLFTIGTTTVQYIATDSAGLRDLCTFTITVRDVTPPNFNNCPPADIMLTAVSGCRAVATWTAPTATDACSNTTLTFSHMPGDTFPLGTTTVEYIAVDESNNADTCSFDIIVVDTEAPVFMGCPLDQTVNIDSASCGAIVNWQAPIPSDNCDTPVLTNNFSPGDFFPVGTTMVRYIATDNSNNADTCDFMITVVDNRPPVLTCGDSIVIRVDGTVISDPGNILVAATTEPGCNTLKVSFTDPAATDECAGNVVVTQTDATGLSNGSSFPIGVTTLQYAATDTSTNTASCDLRIVILPLDPIAISFLPNSTPCLGENVILSVGTLSNVSGYNWSGPSGFGSTDPTPVIDDLTIGETGNYSVTVTFSNGCTLTDDAVLAPLSAPTIMASSNSPVCDGILNLDVTVDPAGEPAASFLWTGPNSFSSMDQTNVIPNADETYRGTYFVTVTGTNGCESRDTLEVNVVTLTAPTITTDCDNSLCLGENCMLIGTEYSPQPDSYNWTATPAADAGLPANTNSRQIAIRPTGSGDIVYSYWVERDGCTSDTATTTVSIVSEPIAVNDTFTIDYNSSLDNFLVLPNDTFNNVIGVTSSTNTTTANGILISNNSNGQYSYTPNRNFIGTDQFVYEICHNCEGQLLCDQAIVTIQVIFPENEECQVPNLISPNGDGTNDELFINCLATGNFNSNELKIINKWGDEVFSAAPYLNNWQGTHKGKDLPDGTYYYIFKLNSTTQAQTGFITIFR